MAYMNQIFLILLSLLLTSCKTLESLDNSISPMGNITTEVSKMDGIKVVRMTPVMPRHGYKDIQAEFGLYWDTNKKDNAFFTVSLDQASNFSPEKPFEIKIDGELISLPPANDRDYGDIETEETNITVSSKFYYNVTQKDYLITKDQILKIANGSEGFYRIWFMNNKYSEGEIDYSYQDYKSYIPKSFRDFHEEVWGGK